MPKVNSHALDARAGWLAEVLARTPSGEVYDPVELMTDRQVARLIAVSRTTLQIWRHRHIGPPSIKIGVMCRYRRRDLLRWLNTRATLHDGDAPPRAPVFRENLDGIDDDA